MPRRETPGRERPKAKSRDMTAFSFVAKRNILLQLQNAIAKHRAARGGVVARAALQNSPWPATQSQRACAASDTLAPTDIRAAARPRPAKRIARSRAPGGEWSPTRNRGGEGRGSRGRKP